MHNGFKIKIREDGSTVITSESFSGELHLQAEEFRAWLQKKLGGESVSARNTETHSHEHDGLGEHTHEKVR